MIESTKIKEMELSGWDRIETSINAKSVEKDVYKTVRDIKPHDGFTALDLGTGNGRHSIWMGNLGFNVTAFDDSYSNLSHLKSKIEPKELNIQFKYGKMDKLPFANSTFDYVLAWEVLNQPELIKTQKIISEIYRVLKPGGLFQGSILSKRNVGLLPESNSSLLSVRLKNDKRSLFYCCNAMEIVHTLTGFELLKLKDKERKQCRSHYWHFVAEKY